MARPRRIVAARAALGLATCLVLIVPASAQGLRRLHVEALSMRADRTHLQVHQIFHLAIHSHVREHVKALDEVVVPDVGTMQLEGDERRVTQGPNGTDVVETLTLEPVAGGTYTFKGAYLDAIDARTGKPSRFSSNPVTVVVEGPSLLQPDAVVSVLRSLLGAVLSVLGLVAAVFVVLALARTRRRHERPVVSAPEPVADAPPPRTPRDAVAEALRAYRSSPANGSLTVLRAALFDAAGTGAGATLRDALAATSDRALQAALKAAERATFGPAHLRDRSSQELIDATEGWLR
jgi:hypothetical protein